MKGSNKTILNEKGQTAVEYTLLLAVVIVLAIGVFKNLNDYLINNPDSFQNKYLNSYTSFFQGNNGSFSGQYKHFIIRR